MITATVGRHRYRMVVQPPPGAVEKYIYASRSLPYLAVAMSIAFLAAFTSQLMFEINTGYWMFSVFTIVGTIAFAMSMPLGLTGRGFSLDRHRELISSWCPRRYPNVDIFLPCCGEPIDVLRNSWISVVALVDAYPGRALAYVLDDAADPDAGYLARSLGLNYVIRPNRGEHKKSGNLRYAFAHTDGEFISKRDLTEAIGLYRSVAETLLAS